MNKLIAAAVIAFGLIAPAMAQQAAPAAQPGIAGKATEAATGMAQKMLGNATATTAATAPKVQLVNINKASMDELDSLPQIGKARSEAIVKARPYKTTDELVSKKVLSQGVYDTIKDRIGVR